MRHLLLRSLLITPLLALIAFAQGAVSPALGACPAPITSGVCGDTSGPNGTDVPCRCGDLVTTDTELNGTDPVLGKEGCPVDTNGLFVASGVTLRIGGTMKGQPGSACSSSGIVVVPDPTTGVATDVVVEVGKIVGFDFGVEAPDVNVLGTVVQSRFSRLQIQGNTCGGCSDSGIAVRGDDNTIEQNVIKAPGLCIAGIRVSGANNTVSLNKTDGVCGEGFRVGGGSGNDVSRNMALRSGTNSVSFGFLIDGDGATVDRNQAKYGTSDGFQIGGTNHTVTLNLAQSNADNGFAVSCIGCEFGQNISNYNGLDPVGPGFGILDTTSGPLPPPNFGTANSYTGNNCVGNGAGDSDPVGLCL